MRDPAINAIAPAVPYTRPISFVESPNPPSLRFAFRKGDNFYGKAFCKAVQNNKTDIVEYMLLCKEVLKINKSSLKRSFSVTSVNLTDLSGRKLSYIKQTNKQHNSAINKHNNSPSRSYTHCFSRTPS